MSDLFTIITENWTNFVFGSPLITGMIILGTFILFGVKHDWDSDAFIITIIPLLAILSGFLLPDFFFVLALISMGVVLGMALTKILSR